MHALPWRLLIKFNRFVDASLFCCAKKNWKLFCLIRDRYVIAYGVPYRNCIAIRRFQTYSVHWEHTMGIVNVAHVHVFNMPFGKMSSMNEYEWKRCQNDGKKLKDKQSDQSKREACKRRTIHEETKTSINVDHFGIGNLIILLYTYQKL